MTTTNLRFIKFIGGNINLESHTVAEYRNELSGKVVLIHNKIGSGRISPIQREFVSEASYERYMRTHASMTGHRLLNSVLGDIGVAGFPISMGRGVAV